MQNLVAMRRADFCKDLRKHPQRDLLVRLVAALNRRAAAEAPTLLVKIRAHTGEPMNEAADEAADEAVDAAPPEPRELDEARCYFEQDQGGATACCDPRLLQLLT